MSTTVPSLIPDVPDDVPRVGPLSQVLALVCVSYSNRDPSARALPLLNAWVQACGGTLWVQCYDRRLIGPTRLATELLDDPAGWPAGTTCDLVGCLRSLFRRDTVLPDGRALDQVLVVHNAQEEANDLGFRGTSWATVRMGLLITQAEWQWRVEAAAQRLRMPVYPVAVLAQRTEEHALRSSLDAVLDGRDPLDHGRARRRL